MEIINLLLYLIQHPLIIIRMHYSFVHDLLRSFHWIVPDKWRFMDPLNYDGIPCLDEVLRPGYAQPSVQPVEHF